MIPANDIQLNKLIANKMAVRENVSNRFLKDYEKALEEQYKTALKDIQDDLSKLYDKLGEDGELFWTEYNRFNRKKSLEKQIRNQLRELNAKNVKTFNKAIKGHFQDGYYSTQFANETSMGLSFKFAVLSKEQVQAAVLNPVDAIKWTERSMDNINKLNKSVRETIAQSVIKGESQAKTLKALSKKMDITRIKARTIIRTETHRARQMGNSLNFEKTKKSFESLGLKRSKRWDATLDTKTRPSHANADGTLANEEGNFELFGFVFPAPGLSGSAENDILCRCAALTETEGFSPKTRMDNEDRKIIPYANFSEWAESRGLSKNIYGQKYLKAA